MAPFTVSPATYDDLPSLARVFCAAFNDNPRTLSYWIFTRDDEAAIYDWRLADMTHRFHVDDDSRYYKLIDEDTGAVAGLSIWQVPSPPDSEHQQARKEEEEEAHEERNSPPKGTKRQLLDDFMAETKSMRRKYVNAERDFVLKVLAVHPDYQGRGCASTLLRAGLERVDAVGAKSFLEATPQARPLYSKFGWRDIDVIFSDLEQYGCDIQRKQVTSVMVRDAHRRP